MHLCNVIKFNFLLKQLFQKKLFYLEMFLSSLFVRFGIYLSLFQFVLNP